jgi:hypothetical protein
MRSGASRPTHHLRFLYFDNTVDRSRAIDRNVEWGDYTFQAGAVVESQVKFKIIEAAYEYAFMRRPDFELAGSLGVHYMDLQMRLSGVATLTNANGTVSQAAVATREGSAPLPLPVIGVRAGWAVAPQWFLEGQGQFFKAKIGDVDGRITDLRASATWMFSQNLRHRHGLQQVHHDGGCREDLVQRPGPNRLQRASTVRDRHVLNCEAGRRGRRLWRPNLLMGLLMSAMGVLLILGIVSAFF